MEFAIGFIAGVVIGAAVALLTGFLRGRSDRAQIREAFSALAGEALDANSRRLTEMGASALETKKELIER